MTTYEIIKDLCDRKGIAVTALEKELGFGRGSIGKLKNGGNTTMKRLQMIADYFGVDIDYFSGNKKGNEEYYINPETAKVAQEIFENRDLRVLFDAARDASPEDLQTTYDMLMALKKKERGFDDDSGC